MLTEAITDKDLKKFYESVRDILHGKAVCYLQEQQEEICEARMARVNRVRKGKIQRRHKVAQKSGFTIRGGKVTRMSPRERRKRARAQRKGARRRKAKLSRSLRKRKVSLRKSKRLN